MKTNSFSTPSLLKRVRRCFEKVDDVREAKQIKIQLPDCLMSALAVFHLKYPSLLKFDEAKNEQAVKHTKEPSMGFKTKYPAIPK